MVRSKQIWLLGREEEFESLCRARVLSGSLIGERFGVSKSAVIAAAHKRGFPLSGFPDVSKENFGRGPRTQRLWTEEEKRRLRELTDQGVGPAEISKIIRFSVKSVCSQIKRMGLRTGRERKAWSEAPVRQPARFPKLQTFHVHTPACLPTYPAQPVYFGKITECSWPTGEPGTRSFRYCDAPTLPGKTYCDEHFRIAYLPSKPRNNAAAVR